MIEHRFPAAAESAGPRSGADRKMTTRPCHGSIRAVAVRRVIPVLAAGNGRSIGRAAMPVTAHHECAERTQT